MGKVIGQNQYINWRKGVKLTTKNAILAHCYVCNGFENSGKGDCQGQNTCPLYRHSPHGRKASKRAM